MIPTFSVANEEDTSAIVLIAERLRAQVRCSQFPLELRFSLFSLFSLAPVIDEMRIGSAKRGVMLTKEFCSWIT